MKKIAKFHLNLEGKSIRTIEELQENFNIDEILENYENGILEKWLDGRKYNEELEKLTEIKIQDEFEIVKKLMEIFKIEKNEDVVEKAILYRNYRKENYGRLIVKSKCDDEVSIENISRSQEKDYIVINGEMKREIKENTQEEFDLLAGRYKVRLLGNEDNIKDVKIEANKSTEVEFEIEKTSKKSKKPSEKFVLVEGNGKNIKDLYVCKYPVTQKEFENIMGFNPSNFKGENNPVETVNWYDAVMYCNKLSEKENLKPAYKMKRISKNGDTISSAEVEIIEGDGYRLLKSEEWEWAAKGGKKSEGYTYSGSDNMDEAGWYSGNSSSKTHPVGEKKPNELGLYDMSGNVWEWTGTKYSSDSYYNRGGSWGSSINYCKVAYQNNSSASNRVSNIGFRVCRVR